MACRARLPQWMAYRESAATLAFIVGPTLGGFIIAATSLPFIMCLIGSTLGRSDLADQIRSLSPESDQITQIRSLVWTSTHRYMYETI